MTTMDYTDVDIPVLTFGDQLDRARRLRELHTNGLFALPNAWDLASAVTLARLPGIQALATTSAGVAAAQGRPDGEDISLDSLVRNVSSITPRVPIPVSVDLEAGYGATSGECADSVHAVVRAGAVGVNLEDGDPAEPERLLPANWHAEKIGAARELADKSGLPLTINARTDTFWRSVGDPATRYEETVRRLRDYIAAGADCVFVPGFPPAGADAPLDAIVALVAALAPTPLNLLARADLPSSAELARTGLRRLSMGSSLYRLALAAAGAAAARVLRDGDLAALELADHLPYGELAGLLTPE